MMVPPKRQTTRRAFLKGESATRELGDAVDRALGTSTRRRGTRTGAVETNEGPYLLQVSRRAMACRFEVAFNAGQYPQSSAAAIAALDLVEQLEARLTVYRPTSEIMHINRSAAREAVAVEDRLCDLLAMALALSRRTDGAFDITAGPLSKVWGFDRRAGAVPDQEELERARGRVGSELVELDAAARTIRFRTEGVEINLGGIGKGYALDRCAEQFADAGINDYLWHAGNSSLLARGAQGSASAGKDGWVVGILHPQRRSQRLAEIRLRNQALSTSATSTQFFRHNGRRYGHILDPRTGWPATSGVLLATVVAPTAAEAEALSTAFYVLGAERTEELCAADGRIGAALVCGGEAGRGVQVRCFGSVEESVRVFRGN